LPEQGLDLFGVQLRATIAQPVDLGTGCRVEPLFAEAPDQLLLDRRYRALLLSFACVLTSLEF
jgi:hypothetical protein